MKEEKVKHGGSREGAGRPKVKAKEKRVNLIARVHPDTKKRAIKNAKNYKSLGKYLDEIIP